jgi:RHS repeat-associated protein
VTSSSGSGLVQYTYDPFGNTTIAGSSTSTYQYTGRENDGTGLYFFRERYYNSTLQRFISEDPAGLAGGVNSYAYVGDAPSDFTDPLGLSPVPGRGGCKLRVVRDCFDPQNGVRHIDYKLVTDSGDNPQGTYYVTEQLSNLQLSPPWGQNTSPQPNSYNDVIGNPSLLPINTTNSTLQYFLVSPNPNSLDQAFWVPIEVPGVGDFMVQGNWWRRNGNADTTVILANGRRSPGTCPNASLF